MNINVNVPVIGQFGALQRCADAVATFVEQRPALGNLDLNDLSKLLLGALVSEPRADVAAAMILTALIAVRDAPDAIRGDSQTISESRQAVRQGS